MKRKQIIFLSAIILILVISCQFIDVVSKFGFCTNCGSMFRTWNIVVFDILRCPVTICTGNELNDTGVSLFLGRCGKDCEMSMLSGISYGLLGKTRMCRPGGSEIKLLIMDKDTKLICEFLLDYEKNKDAQIRDKLRESLKERLRGRTEPWQKELCKAWGEYKVKHFFPKAISNQ